MIEPGKLYVCVVELCPGQPPRPGDVLTIMSVVHVQHASCFGTWDVTFAADRELMLFEFDDRHVSDVDGRDGFLVTLA